MGTRPWEVVPSLHILAPPSQRPEGYSYKLVSSVKQVHVQKMLSMAFSSNLDDYQLGPVIFFSFL